MTLANLIYFEKAQLPQALANRLIRLAAFQNPEFYRAQAMRMSVWDKPRVIGSAENFPQHIALPRGCLDAAQELLRDNGIRCDLRDERYAGERSMFVSSEPCALTRRRPSRRCCITTPGVLCAPTAFGKTVTAAAMIARRGVNTLVLVHRTELLKQWQERLQAFLGAGKGVVGTIGGGKAKPTGKIDIAVMQSLSRQGEVNALVENYGHVIVDECHHVGAVSFDAILKRDKGEVRAWPDRHADPPRWPAADHLHAVRTDPAHGGQAGGCTARLWRWCRARFTPHRPAPEAGIQDVFRHLAKRSGPHGSHCRGSRDAFAARPQGAGADRAHRTPRRHPGGTGRTGTAAVRAARPDVEEAARGPDHGT